MIDWKKGTPAAGDRFDACVGMFHASVWPWKTGWAAEFQGVTISRIFKTADIAKRAAEAIAREKLAEALSALGDASE